MTESKATLFVIVVAILWAASTLAGRAIAGGLDPGFFLLAEFMVAYLALGIIYRSRMRNLDLRSAVQGLILGMLLFCVHYLVVSRPDVTPLMAINAQSLSVVVITVLWGAMRRNDLGTRAVASVVICGLGVYMVNPMFNTAFLAILVLFALHVVFTALFVRHSSPEHLVVVQTAVATILSIIALHLDRPVIANAWTWIFVLLSALVCVAWGVLVQTKALVLLSPIKVGLLFTLQTVFAVGFLCLFSGIEVRRWAITGILLVILGIVAGLKIASSPVETMPRPSN